MIIKPGILDDTKYQMLRSALGGPTAMEVLVSLWGRVEVASGDHADLILDDAEAIACICKYKGSARKLKEALMAVPFGHEAGFLEQSEVSGMLRVHGWMEKNAGLVQRRNAGKMGGRPLKREGTADKPPVSLRLMREGTGSEPSRVEESRVDKNPPTPQGVGEGDEAHRILTGSGNLRGVTWEQDLRLRQCRADILDWVTVAREVAAIAEDYTNGIDQPVVWLRKVFGNWGRNEKLKNGAPEAGSDARKNVFRGYSEADEPKPKGWVPPSQRGKS